MAGKNKEKVQAFALLLMNKLIKTNCCSLVFLVLLATLVNAQNKAGADFVAWEKSLRHLEHRLSIAKNQMERYEVNALLEKSFSEVLNIENSIKYPFDSLRLINVLSSHDLRFRIVTWMILHDDGSCTHNGFVQTYNKTSKKYLVQQLMDHSEKIKNPEAKTLTPSNWYGAFYYDLIATKYRGQVYYTLLGWDKNNLTSQKKIIEVVTVSPNGKVKFGNNIFVFEKQRFLRHIFEYSATATMILRYEVQTYTETISTSSPNTKKQSKQQQNSFTALKREMKPTTKTYYYKSPMIVFDKLQPIHANAKGIFSMYVADGDSHQAYVFDKGKWRLINTVEARNPEPPKKNTQATPKVEYNLFPPKPPKTKSD